LPSNAILEQACVAGASLAQPYALVVLAEHIRNSPRANRDREALAKEVGEHLAKINAELDPHEQLDKVVVMAEEWTVDNGLLTPTLK
jgi:long-chain acyl-CoA synthetase